MRRLSEIAIANLVRQPLIHLRHYRLANKQETNTKHTIK